VTCGVDVVLIRNAGFTLVLIKAFLTKAIKESATSAETFIQVKLSRFTLETMIVV
jgi:hypothetical protein